MKCASWLLFGIMACAMVSGRVQAQSAAGAGVSYTSPSQWAALSWNTSSQGAALDPIFTSTTPDLSDSFNEGASCPTIVNSGVTGGTWYVIAGGSASAWYAVRGSIDDPYDCTPGYLRMKMFYSATGYNNTSPGWVVSSISSFDFITGQGTMYTYGTTEVKVTFPTTWNAALQPWAAPLWMNGRSNVNLSSTISRAQYQEFDGGGETGLTNNCQNCLPVTLHRWPGNPGYIQPGQIVSPQQLQYAFTKNLFDGTAHIIDVQRTPLNECTWIDNSEVGCVSLANAGDDLRGPMGIISDITVAQTHTDTTQTQEMDITYIKHYPCPPGRNKCI